MNRIALVIGFISLFLIFTLFRSSNFEHYDIDVNGSTQHLYVESESMDNPILLFLHWGPGLSEAPYKDLFNSKLKDYATIVHWDQRGAGKSYPSTRYENLSIKTYIQDTLEVMSHLREKFNQDKILLVGHSWGSLIGINIAERHPELLHAYVSISQIVNTLKSEQLSYEFVLRKTKENELTDLHNQLLEIGNPPYKKPEHWGLQRKVLHDFGGILYGKTNDDYMAFTQEYVNAFTPFSEDDKKNYMSAYQKSVQALFGELLMTDISNKTFFNVPIYFMLGEQDYTVVSSIGAEYFSSISAPKKQLYRFVNSAHSPHIEESNKYQELMISILQDLN